MPVFSTKMENHNGWAQVNDKKANQKGGNIEQISMCTLFFEIGIYVHCSKAIALKLHSILLIDIAFYFSGEKKGRKKSHSS